MRPNLLIFLFSFALTMNSFASNDSDDEKELRSQIAILKLDLYREYVLSNQWRLFLQSGIVENSDGTNITLTYPQPQTSSHLIIGADKGIVMNSATVKQTANPEIQSDGMVIVVSTRESA